MSWGNNGNQQPGYNGVAAAAGGSAYLTPPFYGAGFQSVLAAMSAGALPANIQPSGASSLGGGNPTLLQSMSQGLPLNGTNGVQAPVSAPGGISPAIDSRQMANVPSFSSPTQYGGA